MGSLAEAGSCDNGISEMSKGAADVRWKGQLGRVPLSQLNVTVVHTDGDAVEACVMDPKVRRRKGFQFPVDELRAYYLFPFGR